MGRTPSGEAEAERRARVVFHFSIARDATLRSSNENAAEPFASTDASDGRGRIAGGKGDNVAKALMGALDPPPRIRAKGGGVRMADEHGPAAVPRHEPERASRRPPREVDAKVLERRVVRLGNRRPICAGSRSKPGAAFGVALRRFRRYSTGSRAPEYRSEYHPDRVGAKRLDRPGNANCTFSLQSVTPRHGG
jgi:hypothetical protein